MPRMVDLPVEIVINIASLCSTAEVKTLSETCHLLNEICIPQLYHTIDLSSHNADIGCEPWGYMQTVDELVPPDFIAREWTELDKTIFDRQSLLLRTFAANAAFGKHVRTLCWTILDTSGTQWGEEVSVNSDYESSVDEHEEPAVYVPEDEPLWSMFRSFTNVSAVDICWLREWREVTLPGPLFSSAISLRLGGCMSREFVSCILEPSSDASEQQRRLDHLDLNNLFEWSECEPPLPPLSHLRNLVGFLEVNRANISIQTERLPMVGHLEPLVGHLTSLKSLRIGTIAIKPDSSTGKDTYSHILFASWARLLDSVRATLQSFYFEQGVNRNDEAKPKNGPRPGSRTYSDHRPIDLLFVEHILPVLLEAPWPCMKQMHIRGVGRNTQRWESPTRPTEEQPSDSGIQWVVNEVRRDGNVQYAIEKTVIAIPPRTRKHLRILLGAGKSHDVDLAIEEEQERDWEYLHCGDTGVSRLDM